MTASVAGRWKQPGLGEWDVRALVGHTSRSLVTVETYLARPAERVEVNSTANYYRATQAISAGPDVAERGREAGRALGDNPLATVTDLASRVTDLVGGCDGSELVTTIAGGMRLADYLPTRTFELVVHTTDLCAALALPPRAPESATRQALLLVTELAVGDGLAAPLLMAATGRAALPTGFTVL
jgi:hypothetical protein